MGAFVEAIDVAKQTEIQLSLVNMGRMYFTVYLVRADLYVDNASEVG